MFYKIVRKEGGQLFSCRTWSDWQIVYSTEKWAVALEELDEEGYGPLVFDSPRAVKNFLHRYGCPSDLVFSCEVRGRKEKLPPMYANGCWPEGTVMVSAVRLLEEIKREDL